jgi:hypothetical protein
LTKSRSQQANARSLIDMFNQWSTEDAIHTRCSSITASRQRVFRSWSYEYLQLRKILDAKIGSKYFELTYGLAAIFLVLIKLPAHAYAARHHISNARRRDYASYIHTNNCEWKTPIPSLVIKQFWKLIHTTVAATTPKAPHAASQQGLCQHILSTFHVVLRSHFFAFFASTEGEKQNYNGREGC